MARTYNFELGRYLNEGGNLSLAAMYELKRHIDHGRRSLADAVHLLEFNVDMSERLAGLGLAYEHHSPQILAAKRTISQSLHFLGQCQTYYGDTKGANALFHRAIEFDPDAIPSRIALGRGYLELGEFGRALDELKAACALDDRDPEAHFYLGEAYRELRMMDEAEVAFEQAVVQFPGRNAPQTKQGLDRGMRWEKFGIRSLSRRADIFRWRHAIENAGSTERDVQRIERLAKGRPVYITVMQGRSILSHFVSQVENFTRRLWLDGVRDPFIIVLSETRFPNPALVKMYGRVIWLVDARFPRLRRRLIAAREVLAARRSPIAVNIDRFSPHPEIHVYFNNYQKAWLEAPQILRFTEEEEKRGEQVMREVGIPPEASYICFGIREPDYYAQVLQNIPRQYYWEINLPHGDVQDKTTQWTTMPDFPALSGGGFSANNITRPTALTDYLPTAERLARRGLRVLRMGLAVDAPLPDGLHPNIIDYASRFRTDFGDVYLLANSKFAVCGATGLFWINAAFGKPFVMTDVYVPQVLNINTSRDGVPNLILPRLYWLTRERRFLTFSEMFKTCRFYQQVEHCRADGIEPIANSAADILAVVEEMDLRIDGTWVPNEEDEELQQRCRALLEPYDEGYGLPVHFGAAFLRKYTDLIR